MTSKPIEELFPLQQNGQLTWLELALQGEYQQEFQDWCKDYGLYETEENAFLFFEKKEVDSLSPSPLVDIQFVLL